MENEWKELTDIEELLKAINNNSTIKWVHNGVDFKPFEAKELLITVKMLETFIKKWDNPYSKLELLQPNCLIRDGMAEEYADNLYSVGTDNEDIDEIYRMFRKIAYDGFIQGYKLS